MELEKYLEGDGIAVHSFEDATTIMKILVDNGNCVMLSREEDLWIVHWVWTSMPADRNEVIFISRAVYECDLWAWRKNHPDVE